MREKCDAAIRYVVTNRSAKNRNFMQVILIINLKLAAIIRKKLHELQSESKFFICESAKIHLGLAMTLQILPPRRKEIRRRRNKWSKNCIARDRFED